MSGAELFVACLKAGGVDTIYGVPGEENTDLMLALKGSDIRFVLTRHEQAAAFMASVHGRLTGRPAGCLATLGPGATNLMTGVADATLDFSPMVVITAQAARARMDRAETHQVVDLEGLFAPITKKSTTLISAEAMPGQIAESLLCAVTEKPGAVHLSLPEDLAGAEVTGTPIEPVDRAAPLPAPQTLVATLKAIKDAKEPVIVCGAGALRAGAADDVRRFAEATGIPVVTTFMAAGVLPADHDQNLFTVGQPFADHIDKALAAADMIVAIGVDPVEYPPAKLSGAGQTPVISLSETRSPADAGWALRQEILGALPSLLKSATAGLTGHRWSLSSTQRQTRDAMLADRARLTTTDDADTFAPADVLARVEAQLGKDDIILSGVGTHKMEVARRLSPRRPGQLIIGNGLAGMGMALPGALTAASLYPDRAVMAICGDGDVMMNIQDMETATRLGLSLTVMVWEDGGYNLIEAKQEKSAGTHTDLTFTNPDWNHLGAAFGWTVMSVDRFSDLEAALKTAREVGGPVLMPMKIRYDRPLEDRIQTAA